MDDFHAQIELEWARVQMQAVKMTTYTLVGVMCATFTILLVGLFMPNSQIDNNEIWKILGPAFFTVSGALTGAFATKMGMKTKEFDPNAAHKTYTDVKQSDDRFKEVQAHEESAVKVEQIKADAAVEMARLESGYYKPFTYEDGHVDPEAQEGSKADARWDDEVERDHGDEPSDGHWTQRI